MRNGMKTAVWLLCMGLLLGGVGCSRGKEEENETIKWGTIGGIEQIMDDTTVAHETMSEAPVDVTPERMTGEATTETPEELTMEPETPEAATEKPTDASTEAPTKPTQTSGDAGITFDVDLGALANLSNEIKSWGPGVNMDDKNRPTGSTMYQKKYGQYDADYIREESQKIYLTLDEGYENGYTAVILDALKEKQVSAVFFVTMSYVKKEPELIWRMINEGHVVGAHSVTHPADGMPSLSLEAQLAELRDLHEYVKAEFGYEMYLFRYPAGIFSEQSLALVQATGYRSVFWSYAYRDWVTDDQPEPTAALEKALNRLHPGAIYLLHAVSATNAQIMGDFIDQARAMGYEFVKYEAE